MKVAQKPLEVKYTGEWLVELPLHLYAEMQYYVDKYDKECSGAMMVKQCERDGKQVFSIYDVFLPAEQHNTAASTDIEADAVARLVTQLVRENRPTEDLRGHWHSHVNMDVFHSGTDEDNYKVLATGEWLVSLVLNKRGELLARVDYYKPFKLNVIHVPVNVVLTPTEPKPEWDARLAAMSTFSDAYRPVVKTYPPARGWKDSWDDDYDRQYNDTTGFNDGYLSRQQEDQKYAKERMVDLLAVSEMAVLKDVTPRWNDEVECVVIEPQTLEKYRLTLRADCLGRATEQELMEVDNGKI